MLAHQSIKILNSFMSDDCEEKPCSRSGADNCELDGSNVCNCNEPLTFDDDYNCVGEYKSFMVVLHLTVHCFDKLTHH